MINSMVDSMVDSTVRHTTRNTQHMVRTEAEVPYLQHVKRQPLRRFHFEPPRHGDNQLFHCESRDGKREEGPPLLRVSNSYYVQ